MLPFNLSALIYKCNYFSLVFNSAIDNDSQTAGFHLRKAEYALIYSTPRRLFLKNLGLMSQKTAWKGTQQCVDSRDIR